jgi:hypothetical protein
LVFFLVVDTAFFFVVATEAFVFFLAEEQDEGLFAIFCFLVADLFIVFVAFAVVIWFSSSASFTALIQVPRQGDIIRKKLVLFLFLLFLFVFGISERTNRIK